MIHLAIYPGLAGHKLAPGTHVGLLADGRFGSAEHPIGIVDPFLKSLVCEGERFWVFFYPNSRMGAPDIMTQSEQAAVENVVMKLTVALERLEAIIKNQKKEGV